MCRRLAMAGTLSLAGCSLLPAEPYVDRRSWPLVVRRPGVLPPRQNGKILLVRSVRAAPELETRGLQWLQHDGSVHVDYYEQWAVPPAQAVDDDLRQWLAASGIYSAVLAPGSRLTAELVLEGELNTFIGDLPAGVGRVELAIVLLDQQPNPAKVKLQQTVAATSPLTGTSVPDLVAALRAALEDVLHQAELAVARA
jgi:cholesterol transport system auxiliary component